MQLVTNDNTKYILVAPRVRKLAQVVHQSIETKLKSQSAPDVAVPH